MNSRTLFISGDLWRTLQTPPSPHWTRQRVERGRSNTLLFIAILTASLLISGVMMSVMIVYRATDAISHDYEKGRFDLLAVTPPGGFGASWARLAGFLHYQLTLKTFNRMRFLAVGTLALIAGLTLITLFIPALQNPDAAMRDEAWQWLLFYLFVVVMTYLDHYYALVSGGLVSVLLPTIPNTDTRVLAIFVAVALHFTGYITAALTGGIIIPATYAAFGVSGWTADVVRAGLALLVFVLIHEVIVLLLYRTALERLNSGGLLPVTAPLDSPV